MLIRCVGSCACVYWCYVYSVICCVGGCDKRYHCCCFNGQHVSFTFCNGVSLRSFLQFTGENCVWKCPVAVFTLKPTWYTRRSQCHKMKITPCNAHAHHLTPINPVIPPRGVDTYRKVPLQHIKLPIEMTCKSGLGMVWNGTVAISFDMIGHFMIV